MAKHYELIIFDWNGTLSTGALVVADGAVAPLCPGVREVLDKLKSDGLHLAIATMASRQGLFEQLQAHHIKDYFEAFSCGDDDYNKPEPGVLESILDQTGVNVEHALMVGDSAVDMECARCAGIDGIQIGVSHDDKEPVCLDEISALLDWLDQ